MIQSPIRFRNRALLLLSIALPGLIGCAGEGRDRWIDPPDELPFETSWQPARPDLHDVWFEGERGWAIGDHGLLLETTDGGETWDRRDVGVTENLRALFVLDPDRAWIAGAEGTVVATRNGGESWEVQPTGTEEDLSDIHFLDPNRGWAVGPALVLLRTANGGRHWQEVESLPTFDSLVRIEGWSPKRALVHFRDEQNGTVLVDELRVQTSDGGRSWAYDTLIDSYEPLPDAGQTLASPAGHLLEALVGHRLVPFERRAFFSKAGRSLLVVPKVRATSSPSTIVGEGVLGGVLLSFDGGARWNHLRGKSDFAHVSIVWLGTLEPGIPFRTRTTRGFSPAVAPLPIRSLGEGWILDQYGSVWKTAVDGTWQERGSLPFEASALHVSEQGTGWVVGERSSIARSTDGGQTWHRVLPVSTEMKWIDGAFPKSFDLALGSSAPLAISSGERIWAVGDDASGQSGLLISSQDGGFSWQERARFPATLHSIFFLDQDHGWLTGEDGQLVRTTDGGSRWRPLADPSDFAGADLESVAFTTPERGWVVADGEELLSTVDGERWSVQALPRSVSVSDIHFLDPETGWITASRDDTFLNLLSLDGGSNWQAFSLPLKELEDLPPSNPLLLGLTTATARVIGPPLRPLRFDRREYFVPTRDGLLRFFEPEKQWSGVLAIEGFEGSFDPNFVHGVAFDRWNGWLLGSDRILTTTNGGRSWVLTDLPSEDPLKWMTFSSQLGGRIFSEEGLELIGEVCNRAPFPSRLSHREIGDEVDLVLRVTDEAAEEVVLVTAEYRENKTRWLPFGEIGEPLKFRHDGSIQLRWKPAAHDVAAGSEIFYRFTLRDVAGLEYTHALDEGFVYRSWWSRQGSVMRVVYVSLAAYLAYFGLILLVFWRAPGSLPRLLEALPLTAVSAPGMLAPLLRALAQGTLLPHLARHSRVRAAWIRRYRAGDASFGQLPENLVQDYVGKTDVLDAWVARRIESAREAFARLPTVEGRPAYIPLPLVLREDAAEKRLIEPKAADFRRFDAAPTRLVVVARGGAGKTTLACQLGHWALAGKLADFPMIPVLVEEETADLLATVRLRLTEMVGPDGLDEPLFLELLRAGRVLVMVDALSERTPETQRAIRDALASGPLDAVVVTSRRAPDFGGSKILQVLPQRIDTDVDTLVTLLVHYLRSADEEALPTADDTLELAKQLLAMVERSAKDLVVTPLLIKLFADSARAARDGGSPLRLLPTSVPEIMLEYLRRVNPGAPGTPNRMTDADMIRAARLLGRLSVETAGQPRDFRRSSAEEALTAAGLDDGQDPVARLIGNGVLQAKDIGGTVYLGFELDPLAEYLAALELLHAMGSDSARWQEKLEELAGLPGYPGDQRDFLTALDDCANAYREALGIPELDFTREASLDASPIQPGSDSPNPAPDPGSGPLDPSDDPDGPAR